MLVNINCTVIETSTWRDMTTASADARLRNDIGGHLFDRSAKRATTARPGMAAVGKAGAHHLAGELRLAQAKRSSAPQAPAMTDNVDNSNPCSPRRLEAVH